MLVAIIVLAIVAVATVCAAIVLGRRLGAQRALTAVVEQRVGQVELDLAATRSSLGASTDALALANARAGAAEGRADAAEASVDAAVARAALAESRAAGVDPELLWALERRRSERTWRHSVAVGPGESPVSGDAVDEADVLRAALQVELDAAREEVGVEADLDVELPPSLGAASALLALRATQELLAPVVREREAVLLRIRAADGDLVIELLDPDHDDDPVTTLASAPPGLPASTDVEWTPGGARIPGAAQAAATRVVFHDADRPPISHTHTVVAGGEATEPHE